MEFLLVGVGGALGSLTRYGLGRLVACRYQKGFPLGTFLINISGALLLGVVYGLKLDTAGYNLLSYGFLGAYTTFSTFMAEGWMLFQGRKYLNLSTYIAGSLIAGIAGFVAGFQLAAASLW